MKTFADMTPEEFQKGLAHIIKKDETVMKALAGDEEAIKEMENKDDDASDREY